MFVSRLGTWQWAVGGVQCPSPTRTRAHPHSKTHHFSDSNPTECCLSTHAAMLSTTCKPSFARVSRPALLSLLVSMHRRAGEGGSYPAAPEGGQVSRLVRKREKLPGRSGRGRSYPAGPEGGSLGRQAGLDVLGDGGSTTGAGLDAFFSNDSSMWSAEPIRCALLRAVLCEFFALPPSTPTWGMVADGLMKVASPRQLAMLGFMSLPTGARGESVFLSLKFEFVEWFSVIFVLAIMLFSAWLQRTQAPGRPPIRQVSDRATQTTPTEVSLGFLHAGTRTEDIASLSGSFDDVAPPAAALPRCRRSPSLPPLPRSPPKSAGPAPPHGFTSDYAPTNDMVFHYLTALSEGYPSSRRAERKMVVEALQRLGASCCGEPPLDCSGTNQHIIRVKCGICHKVTLRYQVRVTRGA